MATSADVDVSGVPAAGISGPALPVGLSGPLAWSLAARCGSGVLFAVVLIAGLALRQTVWDRTEPIRMRYDIANGMRVGSMVLGEAERNLGRDPYSREHVTWLQFFGGYRSLYDRVETFSPENQYGLDYVPLRMLVMSAWVKYTRDTTPADGLGYRDELAWPLLWFNTVVEFAAAVLVFALVDLWTGTPARRAGSEPLDMPGAAVASGWAVWHRLVAASKWRAWLAALLLWFNPAVLLDAHAWPQWDVWVLPFYLGAMLLGSTGRWFLAGACAGVGCMFKGQMLLVAPTLLLWPLFLGNFGGAARAVLGFGVGWLGVASPWLLSGPRACWAVASALLASALLASPRITSSAWVTRNARVVALLAVVLPWITAPTWARVGVALALATALFLHPVQPTRPDRRYWLAAMGVGSLLAAALCFGGSWAWFDIGYGHGLRDAPVMAHDMVDNLPAVLAGSLDWTVQTEIFSVTLPFAAEPVRITARAILGAAYLGCLVLCAAGAAAHQRRRDPQALVALVAPWVLMFALNVQMRERYLLWGAALGAVAAASSAGLTLLNLLVSAIAAGMIAQFLLPADADYAPRLLQFLRNTSPALGWTVTLVAAIYLFGAVWPRSRVRDPSARLLSDWAMSTERVGPALACR